MQARPGSGRYHSGIVRGESQGWEGDVEVAAGGLGGEAGAQFAIGGNSSGDEDAGDTEGFLGGEGLLQQIADDGVLKAGDEIEGLRVAGGKCLFEGGSGESVGTGKEGFAAGLGFRAEVVELNVAENGRFDSGKREEEPRVEVCDGSGFGGLGARGLAAEVKLGLDLREGEGNGAGVAVQGESVDPGATGIAEAEEFGDLVVCFAGGVVDGAADEGVGPGAVGWAGEIKMSVTAGDD